MKRMLGLLYSENFRVIRLWIPICVNGILNFELCIYGESNAGHSLVAEQDIEGPPLEYMKELVLIESHGVREVV